MGDLSVEDVKAILEAKEMGDVSEEDLLETTQRMNALMDGLDRMEESGELGDGES